MQIELICPELKKLQTAQDVFKKFVPRIKQYTKFRLNEFKPEKYGDPKYKVDSDEVEILKKISEKDFVIALDEIGKEFTSVDLSRKLSDIQNDFSGKKIVFVIGGPYGLGTVLKKRADLKLSLSKLTFNSEIALILFIEQLYRILTIKFNHPYHND